MSGNRPEKTFRIGSVAASVFVNSAKAQGSDQLRTYRTVSLDRRYLDGDEWRSTSSLRLADLPNAMAVLRLATDHVLDAEATAE